MRLLRLVPSSEKVGHRFADDDAEEKDIASSISASLPTVPALPDDLLHGLPRIRAYVGSGLPQGPFWRTIYYCHQNKYQAQQIFCGINSVIHHCKITAINTGRNHFCNFGVGDSVGSVFCRDLFWMKRSRTEMYPV